MAPASRSHRLRFGRILALVLVAAVVVPSSSVAGSAARAGHGLLSVTTDPAVAAAISVDGTVRNTGRVTALELPVGEHEVCFGGVEDHLPPPCQSVTLEEGATESLVGRFTPSGLLEVTIEPADLNPTVEVDGVPRDRGTTTVAVEGGTREVCFEAMTGYETVPCQRVDVVPGATEELLVTYAPLTGDAPGPARADEDVIALYDFAERSGSQVGDSAGVIGGMDLTIADASRVTWTDGGLRFDAPTIARTAAPPKAFYDAVAASKEFTVEAWVTPANTTQDGPARIVTLSADTTRTNFLVGQGAPGGPSALVETRLHERSGDYWLRTADGSLQTDATHVVMTRAADGTVRIYVDGALAAEKLMASTLDAWDQSFLLALGNELDGSRPWLGTFHLVALHDRALDASAVATNHEVGPGEDVVRTVPTPEPEPAPAPAPEEPTSDPVVTPMPGEPTPTTMRSSVRQMDISITFDKQYPVGQFANGDFFVVGNPTVTAMSPKWDGQRHGAMLNPQTAGGQGYHAPLNGYDANLNVATRLPLQLKPGDSLIPTWGWLKTDPGAPAVNGSIGTDAPRPSLKQAMVLTVLADAPPEGSFRPPYGGTWKPLYNVASLDRAKLPRLAHPTGGTTDWSTHERLTRQVWLDHKPGFTGQGIHPTDHMDYVAGGQGDSYGRDFAAKHNEAILRLMLDDTAANKERTLIQMVQMGIDMGAVAKNVLDRGGSVLWAEAGGAHGIGRKWPTLFAGAMLNDPTLLGIAGHRDSRLLWGEDGQTYFSEGGLITQTTSMVQSGDAVDPWRWDYSDAASNRATMGTWGDRAWTKWTPHWGWDDNHQGRPGGTSYHQVTTISTNGAALGAAIMGLSEEWNHDPFFDWVDWYMDDPAGTGYQGGIGAIGPRARTAFLAQMWDSYRADYTVRGSRSGVQASR